ncbi:MAG: RHS repeat-associated core domain-containing protein [Clostridia bacterium]|nr:RHS repeat-associated core domain-containing protein [Clostridia bacterium]
MLNTSGAVVVKYEYDAWGSCKVFDMQGNDITYKENDETRAVYKNELGTLKPFRYRDYYYDVETGLYFLKTRYYDPETGRFITIDDLQYLDPETINGLNLYAYCGNNPVMNVDPTGQFIITFLVACFIVGAAVGAAIGGVIAYNAAKNSGATGWELFGWTMAGIFGGAAIGGAIGAFVGYAAPAVGAFFGAGGLALVGGGAVVVSAASAKIVAGALALAGLLVLFSKNANRYQPKDKRSNRTQNEEFEKLANKYGLSNDQRRRLHDKITKKGFGPEKIIEIAKKLFPHLFQ